MTPRQQEIAANDLLRKYMRGGRIEVCHGPYDLDDRTIGRMLCAIAAYDRFDPDSLHDEGVMLFAGFSAVFRIELEIDEERVMRVWLNEDVLQNARTN
jgi:hypothetical protein